ncbi:MAG TPA: hypothetical protein VIT42_04750 [Microlunatus sp.]
MPDPGETGAPRWHAALSHAVLGRVLDGLPEPGRVDVVELSRELGHRWPGGLPGLQAEVARQRATGPWPHPVPEELTPALVPAQFGSALAALRNVLRLDEQVGRVPESRALDADERRLQAEVPPHHGS